MKQFVVLVTLLGVCAGFVVPGEAATAITPQESLDRLKSGNKRYLSGKSIHVRIDPVSRERTAREGQKPVATVLGCSDARVPPEIVFDQGFGELFVVRVAGNVCSTAELASIEYGVKYLKTPLVVVLGHSKCGAVDAACAGAELKGSLPKLMEMIAPAVEQARAKHPDLKGSALVDAAIEANVRKSIADLLSASPGLAKSVQEKKLTVVGAIRDIQHGTVTWLAP